MKSSDSRVRAFKQVSVLLLAVALAGCAPEEAVESASAPAPEPVRASPVEAVDYRAFAEAAVYSSDRPASDREDDAGRKPAEVVAFFEITPGMHVLDLLCGAGYYTEILSRIVGDDGSVTCHNNQPYLQFLGEQWEERFAGDRLPNARRLIAEIEELDLEPATYDAIFFGLGYHDTYYEPESGWPMIDHRVLLAELHEGLKPGGILAVIDHSATPGGDTVEVATTLHRIDEAVVKADMAEAGFTLEAEADILRNPVDARELDVFNDEIRRRTDRFVLRYRKES